MNLLLCAEVSAFIPRRDEQQVRGCAKQADTEPFEAHGDFDVEAYIEQLDPVIHLKVCPHAGVQRTPKQFQLTVGQLETIRKNREAALRLQQGKIGSKERATLTPKK